MKRKLFIFALLLMFVSAFSVKKYNFANELNELTNNKEEIIDLLKQADNAKYIIDPELEIGIQIGHEFGMSLTKVKGKYSDPNEIMKIMDQFFSEETAKVELKKVNIYILNDKVGYLMAAGDESFRINENTKYHFLIDEPDKKILKVSMVGNYHNIEDFIYVIKKIQNKWLIVYENEFSNPITFKNGWITVASSSSLIDKVTYYPAYNLMDGNSKTAWVEGVPGDGIGEWIDFLFHPKQKLKVISITNGYAKDESIYKSNNRLKRVRLSFDNGDFFETQFKDGLMQPQIIEFPELKSVEQIRITILEVYKGTKYNDTGISEVVFQ